MLNCPYVNCIDIRKAIIILPIQHFEADFLWKVSLKILNSGITLKTFTHCYCFTFGLVLDASCLLSLPAVFLFPLGGVVLLSRLLIVFTSLDDVSLPESSPLHKSVEVHVL